MSVQPLRKNGDTHRVNNRFNRMARYDDNRNPKDDDDGDDYDCHNDDNGSDTA